MFKISQKLNFKLLWAANETKNRVEQIEKKTEELGYYYG